MRLFGRFLLRVSSRCKSSRFPAMYVRFAATTSPKTDTKGTWTYSPESSDSVLRKEKLTDLKSPKVCFH